MRFRFSQTQVENLPPQPEESPIQKTPWQTIPTLGWVLGLGSLLVCLMLCLFFWLETPRRIIFNWPWLYATVTVSQEGVGSSELWVGETAPHGRPRAHNSVEEWVLSELIEKGKGSPSQLMLRLGKQGKALTEDQIFQALKGWESRGWVAKTGDQYHVSQALIQYLR